MTEIPMKPWFVWSRGWLLCLMCPMDKVTKDGVHYYRGIRPKKVSRRQVGRWLRIHRRCGFEGIS